jgi:uncharacterized protein YecT (DUF1311 family)
MKMDGRMVHVHRGIAGILRVKRISTVLFLALFYASSLSASSAREDYSRSYQKCLKAMGPIRNASVAGCAESVSDRAKTEINALYRAVHGQYLLFSPDDASKLERAQKAWLAYRNLHCELAGQYIGSPMYYYCPMSMNIQRVSELRALAGE